MKSQKSLHSAFFAQVAGVAGLQWRSNYSSLSAIDLYTVSFL
jgi:hypothetical protein